MKVKTIDSESKDSGSGKNGKSFLLRKATGKETETGSRSKIRREEQKFEGETKFKFESKAHIRATVQTDKNEIYRIQDSGNGNSWLIGTDVYDGSADYANGFVKGISGCTPVLEIPGTLEDSAGNTKPVEIIGRGAFVACGCSDCSTGGKTKILKVPRQVKVVKYFGLGHMYDLVSFEIEAGSELQTIEDYGLDGIGHKTGQTPSKRNTTLILPLTLSSVYTDGIYDCNLFHTIIYCGNHSLTNTSQLESYTSDTVVKVTSQYPSGSQIFKRNPNRTTEAEAEAKEICSKMEVRPTLDFTSHIVNGECEVTGWGDAWDRCPPRLEIPAMINESAVVSVKASAFENCTTEGPILLPSSVKRIGASAFANTSYATAVLSAASELEVGEAAFKDCGKKAQQPLRVSLPQNTSLNGSAFAGANLEEFSFF